MKLRQDGHSIYSDDFSDNLKVANCSPITEKATKRIVAMNNLGEEIVGLIGQAKSSDLDLLAILDIFNKVLDCVSKSNQSLT